MRSWLIGVPFALLALLFSLSAHTSPKPIPLPALDDPKAPGDTRTAVLAGGCYWGMQALFEHVKGVREVVAGLSGFESENIGSAGSSSAPAEAVEIQYDPSEITYGEILQLYFSVAHDPTEVDRQGPDVGPRYRSLVYYGDEGQKRIAAAYIAQLESAHVFASPIATRVAPLVHFRKVDASQQDYVTKHLTTAYVIHEDLPKIAALKILYPAIFLEQPIAWPG